MIQLESVRIVELRGIRELKLEPARGNFVVSGPNGSGKSGVVDAIQFGLTGDISRLGGKGTAGLTVQKHGPHVDRRDDPASAEVSLTLYFPDLGKTAVVTRNVKTSRTYTLEPDDPAIRTVLDEVARHPELTLSRREIIKYILVEAGERSKQIQALLKLEDVGKIRSTLGTARNRVTSAHTSAQKESSNAADALRRHLDIKVLSSEDILAVVNTQRRVLGLAPIEELTAETALNAGAPEAVPHEVVNRATATRDLQALIREHQAFAKLGTQETGAILKDLATLEGDPALRDALTRRSLLEMGLVLVDGPRCPLCDLEWDDVSHLKEHLRAKLAKSAEAEAVQERLLKNAEVISGHATRVVSLLAPIRSLATSHGSPGLADQLATWAARLNTFSGAIRTVEGVLRNKGTFEHGWITEPDSLATELEALLQAVLAKQDQGATATAISFLTLAQDRLHTYRQARRAEKRASDIADSGKQIYATYCEVAGNHLSALYSAVETDFSSFYQQINGDDEIGFKARFEPTEGKLDLEVAFYDRGMFPPQRLSQRGAPRWDGCLFVLGLDEAASWEAFFFRRARRCRHVGRPRSQEAILPSTQERLPEDPVHNHYARQSVGEANADGGVGSLQERCCLS